KLFSILDDDKKNYLSVSAIHDEQGYQDIRQMLSQQYNLSNLEPNIQIHRVEVSGDRSLTLQHIPTNQMPLAKSCQEVVKHLHRLWGFDIRLEEVNEQGIATIIAACPDKQKESDDL
ncbi:SpoVR family protein, partial [Shewanella sp.]|uniref:SpoVR family protein n=1 Tax=Shewanella sp. TaxID=50422 RepID=UPI001EB86627